MTRVLYCNINQVPDNSIDTYVKKLPEFMQHEIVRYKQVADQKSSLMARLMIQEAMKRTVGNTVMDNWKRDSNNKPFIEGWKAFNIAHAGDLVVLGYGDSPLGIDIEKKVAINYEELSEFFHPAEQEYIMNSENREETFYEVWVKKEAVLKAIGTGIINGLKEFDCTTTCADYNGNRWYFHCLQLDTRYTCYLCSLSEEASITSTEFILEQAIKTTP